MNNKYFTRTDLKEAIETIINAKSENLNVALHNVGEVTDVPKTMHFCKVKKNKILIVAVDELHKGDENYGFNWEVTMDTAKSDMFIDELYNDEFNMDLDEYEAICQRDWPDDIRDMIENGEDHEAIIDCLRYEIACLVTDLNNYANDYGWNHTMGNGIDLMMKYIDIIIENKYEDETDDVIHEANLVYGEWIDYIDKHNEAFNEVAEW